jgi:putative transposase
MVASTFISQGYEIKKILAILQIPTSSWYYKSTERKSGLRASSHTSTLDGKLISNIEVVEHIEVLLQQDFVDYGYIKVTHWLRQKLRLIINFKKVYRLMKENRLLYHQHKRDRKGKSFIEFRVPKPELPFEHMEIDIKFIWIHAAGRMAYLLSILDIKTRAILGWLLQYSIKKDDVVALIQAVASWYCLPIKVTIRSDNGAQFEAKIVREHLYEIGIQQEFSHVATPQDNGHIESYHAIIKKAVCNAFEFLHLEHAWQIIYRFVEFYNLERLHSGIGYNSPNNYLFQLGIQLPAHPLNGTYFIPKNRKIYLFQFVESDSKL